jgi:PAS domain S-box-containing protein
MIADLVGKYLRRPDDRGPDLMQWLDEGVCLLDDEGQVTYCNGALARLTGCTSDAIVGRQLASAIPAVGHSLLLRAMAEAQRIRQPRTEELRLPINGSWRVLAVKIVPIDAGVTLYWRDVTPQRQAERAQQRAEERLALTNCAAC